ncbi:MAG: DUF58 domain-containing protein [Acidibacillus sp.]|nr:DUF58 domain-containing protein [Acidibacillus sp.]
MSVAILLFILFLLVLLFSWNSIWQRYVPPHIQVQLSVSNPSIRFGEQAELHIIIENRSSLPAPNVLCFFELPPQISLHQKSDNTESSILSKTKKAEEVSFVIAMRPRESATVSYPIFGIHRGHGHIQKIRVELSNGFSTYQFTDIATYCDIVVHPADRSSSLIQQSLHKRPGTMPTLRKLFPMSTDWVDLRPYQSGDSMRDIAWMISAKQRELVVFERATSLRQQVLIVSNIQLYKDYWSGNIPSVIERIYEETMALALSLLSSSNALITILTNAIKGQRSHAYQLLHIEGAATSRNQFRIGHELGRLSTYAMDPMSAVLASIYRSQLAPTHIMILTAYEDEDMLQQYHRLTQVGHEIHKIMIPIQPIQDQE